MIAETRRTREEVLPTVRRIVDWLAPHALRIDVGGSVRRGKPTVKDVELVVLQPAPSYFAELDRALAAGEIAKARLGPTGATRWGEKYRSIDVAGLTIELYCCDLDNAGYQMVLRTGPADANEYLVTQIKYRCEAWRIEKGYLWAGQRKLTISTEADFFALCGMAYIEPHLRSEAAYRKAIAKPKFRWGDPSGYVKADPAATQAALPVAAPDSELWMPKSAQAQLDAMFLEVWREREAVFLERYETEIGFSRERYRAAQDREQATKVALEEHLMRDEANGVSDAVMRKTKSEFEYELAEHRDAMRQASQRADWLRGARFTIWLGRWSQAIATTPEEVRE